MIQARYHRMRANEAITHRVGLYDVDSTAERHEVRQDVGTPPTATDEGDVELGRRHVRQASQAPKPLAFLYAAAMPDLPPGVSLHPLTPHLDDRGAVCEAFRSEWTTGADPTQWTFVRSHANVIRGMHCHVRRTDLLTVMDGSMRVVLADVRPSAPSPIVSLIELRATDPELLIIPPGVAHAFETLEPAIVLCGLDTAWTPEDELGCSWTDPAIAHAFATSSPVLSERDATAGTFEELRTAYAVRCSTALI